MSTMEIDVTQQISRPTEQRIPVSSFLDYASAREEVYRFAIKVNGGVGRK